MNGKKAAFLSFTCLILLTSLRGVPMALLTSGSPEMIAVVKETNTTLRLHFNEVVSLTGTYSNEFSLIDCKGNSFAVPAIADDVAGDMNILLTTDDLSTSFGDLTLIFFNLNDPIIDLNNDPLGTNGTGLELLSDLKYDVSEAIYESKFYTFTENSDPRAFTFNSDGTKLYMLGVNTDATIYEYMLNTPYEVQSSSYTGNSLSVGQSGAVTSPLHIEFTPDGSRLFVGSFVQKAIYEYQLTTNFDITTASLVTSHSNGLSMTGFQFNADGSKLYIMEILSDRIWEYSLSTPYDLATRSSTANSNLVLSMNIPVSFDFNHNGTKLFAIERNDERVEQYSLAVPYDLSTVSYDGTSERYSVSLVGQAGAIGFNHDGSELYVIGTSTNKSIFQFSLGENDAPELDQILISTSSEIEVLYSEPVIALGSNPANFQVVGDGNAYIVNQILDNAPGDNSIKLEVNTSPGLLTNLTTSLTVTYADATNNGEISDDDCNRAFNDATGITLTVESQPPVILSSQITGTEFITLNFDERVQSTGMNLSNFTITDCRGFTYTVQAIEDDTPGDHVLTLQTDDLTAVSGDITISYDGTSGAAITDFSANPLANTTYSIPLRDQFDVSQAQFIGASGQVALGIPSPDAAVAFDFDDDGDRLFVVTDEEKLYEYALSAPYDVATATQVGSPIAFTGYNFFRSMRFNDVGDKLYFMASSISGQGMIQFDLSTPYDLSTLSSSPALTTFTEDPNPGSFVFDPGGSKLYVYGFLNTTVFEYDLSTPYDLSSLTYTNRSLVTPSGIFSLGVTPDGAKFFAAQSTVLYEYSLSDAFDLSTAVYNGNAETLSFAAIGGSVSHFQFVDNGTQIFAIQFNPSQISRFDIADFTPPTLNGISKNRPDEVTVSFSENVSALNQFPGSFTVSDGSNLYTPSAVVDGIVGDNLLKLTFGSALASSSQLTVTYNNSSGNNEVADLSCNYLDSDPTGVTINLETVAPEVQFVQVESNNELSIVFNEPVQVSNSISGANFALTDCDGTTFNITDVADGTLYDERIWLTSDDLTTANGELSLQITTTNFEITDLSGNAIDGGSASLLLDGNYNMADAVFLGAGEQFTFSVDTYPTGLEFDNTGLKMYMLGFDNRRIYTYQLDQPFDVSSAVITADSIDVDALYDVPLQIKFDPTGTELYMVGVPVSGQVNYISQLSLTTAYDVTTATFTGSFDSQAAGGENVPTALQFNADGSRFFLLGTTQDNILQYSLSTNYDLNTASFLGNAQALDVATPSGGSATSFLFDNTGSFMYLLSNNLNLISEFYLSTPFDVLTATLNASSQTFTIAEDSNPRTLVFNADGSRAFIAGEQSSSVYEYLLVDEEGPELSSASVASSTEITITFNEPTRATGSFPGDFAVIDLAGAGSSFAVSAITDAVPDDEVLTLVVSDLSTARGDVQVTYSDVNSEVADLNCNDMNTDMNGVAIDLDTTPPALVSAQVDHNTQISVTFSEPVQTNAGNPMDFVVTDGVGTTFTVISQADGVALDEIIVLTVSDVSGAVGDLNITYSNNNQEISDFGNNVLATDGVGVTIDLDQQDPILVSGSQLNSSSLSITFNEAVQLNGSTESDFDLVDGAGNSVALAGISDNNAFDAEVELSTSNFISEALGDLYLSYNNNNDLVSDFGGNSLQTTIVPIEIDLDQIAPTLTGVSKDSDTQLTISFSEPVQTSGSNANDFEVIDDLGTSIMVTAIADGTAQDEELILTVSSLSVVNNDITVTFIGGNGVVSDFGGNELATDNVGINLDIVAPAQPVITGVSDDNGVSSSDGITNDNTFFLDGNAEALSTVELFIDEVSTTTATADASGNFSFDFTGSVASDGTYEMTVTATDAGGNTSTASSAFELTIDTNAPIVSSLVKNQTGKLGEEVTSADFGITFSESITGLDATDFELVFTGTTEAVIGTIAMISSTEATIEIKDIEGEGTIGLNLLDDDSIEDTAGNSLGGAGTSNGDFTGEIYETKASQTITFTDPLGAYGDVLMLSASTSSGLPVDYSLISGPATLSDDQLTITGVGSIEIEASQTGDDDFNPAMDVSVSFSASKATLTASADDQTITFGEVVPGLTVTYTGFVGSDAIADLDTAPEPATTATDASDAGTYAITISGGSDELYDFDYQDGELTINQASQSLTFDAISDIDLNDTNEVTLVASASSGLAPTFTVTSGDGTLSGNTLTINAAGTFTIEASQGGNTNYAAATSVVQSFEVSDTRRTDQTITFGALSDKIYGDTAFSLTASASSSLPVTFTLSGPGTLDGSELTITGAGTVVVTASQPGDGTYNPAPSVEQSFDVDPATLTVTPDDQLIAFGEAIPTLTLTYSGFVGSDTNSDLDNEPTLSTTATTTSEVGTYDITVSGGSDDNYSFSYQTGTFTISKADQTITFDAISDFDVSTTSTATLSAASSSGLDVTYALTNGDGAISGNVVTVNNSGNFTVVASQAGNDNYNAAPDVSQTFQVTDSRKTNQTITFDDDLSGLTYGDDEITLSAIANSQLSIIYEATGPVSITENIMTVVGAGAASVTATQPGDDDFNPATSVTIDFIVGKATLTATAENATVLFGSDIPSFIVSLSDFVGDDTPDMVDLLPSATTDATNGSDVGTYSIEVTGGSDDNYDFSYVAGTLTIEKATQTITFEAIADLDIASVTSVTLAAAASSGLGVSYALLEGDGSIDGNVLTLNNTGKFTVSASQSGNENIEAATVTQSFRVTDSNKEDQEITFPGIQNVEYGDVIAFIASSTSNLPVTYELITGSGNLEGNELTVTSVGSYEVRASQSGNGSFNPAPFVTVQFNSNKADLVARPEDVEIQEGEDLPVLSINYTGLKLGESSVVLDELPVASVDESILLSPGEYPILITGGADDHYEFSLQEGVLTILTILSADAGPQFTTKIYPNPASDIFLLDWSGNSPVSIRILNQNGSIQWAMEGLHGEIELDASQWSRGLYHVQLFEKGKLLSKHKLLVR